MEEGAPDEVRVERARAAFNLCHAISGKDGPAAARGFYDSELRDPAMQAGAPKELLQIRDAATRFLES